MQFKVICVNNDCQHWDENGQLVSGSIVVKHCSWIHQNSHSPLVIGKNGCLAKLERKEKL